MTGHDAGLKVPTLRPRVRSLRLSDYPSAREFFAAVMDASVECERNRRTLLQMEAREGVRAQGYEAQGRSGHLSDRTAQTDARIDYEDRMDERIREDYELLDLACAVLYGGESGSGGLEALMGSAVADSISFRYVDARPWSEVAELTGYSAKQCQRFCKVGFDAVDFFGWDNLVDGVGEAEG